LELTFAHFFNHHVSLFWPFHAVHHSQKHLSFFTDFRYHIVEYIVRHTVLVIPFLIFQINTPTIVVFAVFKRWYTRFYHGNIRTILEAACVSSVAQVSEEVIDLTQGILKPILKELTAINTTALEKENKKLLEKSKD
jgi:hypothetical protein